MSHSLARKGKTKKGMAQHSRSVGAYFVGDLGLAEVRTLQWWLDAGMLSHVELTRDGAWFRGKPGLEFRTLVKWFLGRGFERVDDGQ